MTLKRKAAEMNFPRRRVNIACNLCRHRKRKCDGQKPSCGLCIELSAQCEYQQPTIDKTSEQPDLPVEILERLSSLEQQLKEQSEVMATLPKQNQPNSSTIPVPESPVVEPQFPVFNSPFEMVNIQPNEYHQDNGPTYDVANSDQFTSMQREDTADPPLTIPVGHQTTTGNLFAFQPIKRLIGDYPDAYFYHVEAERYQPYGSSSNGRRSTTAMKNLDLNQITTDELVDNFFENIHPRVPVMDRAAFSRIYEEYSAGNSLTDAKTALCLVVFALGKLSTSLHSNTDFEEHSDDHGMEYFEAAYEILAQQWCFSFETDLSLPLALLYASTYLSFMVRPLHAWKLIHMASTQIQLIISSASKAQYSQEETNCMGRLCWACYVIECDGLAEFHLPRSGIEVLVDGMTFPHFGTDIDRDGLVFLAVCSVRRLLNRIHNAIYSAAANGVAVTSPASLFASEAAHGMIPGPRIDNLDHICKELSRQLDVWYDSLPPSISPNLDGNIPTDLSEGWLRLRYWSTKHIIYRPWVLFVSSLPDYQHVSPEVLTNCQTCLISCQNYIETATYTLSQRTQYTWQTLQAMLACVFVLTIACSSNLISHYVPKFPQLLNEAIRSAQKWSHPDTTAESTVMILKMIRQKQRLKMHRT